MFDFILRLFIKDYKDTQNPDIRRKYGVLAGISGIAFNSILFIVKIVVGLLSSSISVAADAINNLSDTASSVMTLVGFKLSGKPADEKHPYGHARFEYLFGLLVSVVITVLGSQTLISSVGKLINGSGGAQYSKAAIIIIGLSVPVKIFMAFFVSRLGKAICSKSLAATAADSISDVITTSSIVVGMLLTPYTGSRTDGVLGCIIAVYIIILGIKLIIDTAYPLLGAAPDKEQVDKINSKLKSYDNILGVHDMVIHNYGAGKYFASVHIEVDAGRGIMESHELIDKIESDLARELGIDMVIHMDPVYTDDEHLNELREGITRIVTELSAEYKCQFSVHDFRLSVTESGNNILFDMVIPSNKSIDAEQLCGRIRDRAKEIAPDCNVIITVDRDYTSRRYEADKGC